MTKDFKNMRKWSIEDELSLEQLMIRAMIAFLAFVAVVCLFAVFKTADAQTPQDTAYNHTVSPEIRSYLRDTKTGRKQFLVNEGVE